MAKLIAKKMEKEKQIKLFSYECPKQYGWHLKRDTYYHRVRLV